MEGRRKKPIHILIADDHTLFRETLKKVFDSEPRFLIVGETGVGEEALKLVRLLAPDILLLDWRLSRLSGMEVLRSLAASSTRTRAIVLTGEIDRDRVDQAFKLGARGLALKQSSAQVLFSGIDAIASGDYWIGGESFSNPDEISKRLAASTPENVKPKNFALTPRELQIIAAVLSGHTNKEIAKNFSISEQTVKHHIHNIFDKLGVFNRLELTLFALHHKLIKDSK